MKAPQVSHGGTNYLLPGLIGAGVLMLVGGAVFVGMRVGASGPPPAPPALPAAPAPQAVPAPQAINEAPVPPPAPNAPSGTAAATSPALAAPQAAPEAVPEGVLVRLAGSPQLAAGLAPQLAAAYLTQIGDTDVKTNSGAASGELNVSGQRGDRREAILIDSTGTASGFTALASHHADIVIAPRRILPAERDALAPLGDLTAPTAEHLVGLGAFAVVVNSANALPGLRREQITGIFNGTIRSWSDLGGSSAPINVYGQGKDTDEGATFSMLATGGGDLAASARRLADSRQVAHAVAADARGIGFVDPANILQNRPVPVADTGATPVAATDHVAVAKEDYPLSYRIYLYTLPATASGGSIAQHFADFVVSPAGQAVVEQQGLVSQTATAAAAAVPQTTAGSYKEFVAGAKKLAITFHFNPNSTDLDLKGERDLDRVLNYLVSNHFSPDQLILIGFADNQGDPAVNVAVSKKRADAVAALFTTRGVKPGKVAGFGAELEVADNATEDGREKNRRVEVYIKQ